MNEERQNAYHQLIEALLNCPSGEEAEILQAHPDLLDAGLVQAMLEVADNLRREGNLNNANWLMDIAAIQLGLFNKHLVENPLEKEANRLLELGNLYFNKGLCQAALETFTKALNLYSKIRNQQGKINSLGSLGIAAISLGQYQPAVDYLQQSLIIAREIGDCRGEVASLGNLGVVYLYLGQYQEALDYLQKCLKFLQYIENYQGKAACLGNLGNVCQSLGEYQLAVDCFQTQLAIAQKIGNPKEEANSLVNLGNVYRCLGQYLLALKNLQQSIKILREIGNLQGEAACLGNLGTTYRCLGQYQEALNYYQQQLEIAKKIGDPLNKANSLGNLGTVSLDLGQYQEALNYYQQQLEISREIGARQGEADSLGNLGIAYYLLDKYRRAIDYHQQSLEIKKEIGDRRGEANCLANLGSAYLSLGQYQKAINYYEQSLLIEKDIGNLQGEAISLGNLADVYRNLGLYEEAINYHQQCLAIKRIIGSRRGEANSLANLGNIYLSLGQYQEAINYYEQSLVIERNIGNFQGEVSTLGDLGLAYLSSGQYQKAIDCFQQFLDSVRWIGNRRGEAIALGNLGSAYICLGQYELAINYYQKSLEIKHEIGYRLGDPISLNNLGLALLKTNQLAKAEEKLYKAIQIYETRRSELTHSDHKVSIFETQTTTYRLLQQVLVAQNKFDTALEISERGRTRAFVELLTKTLFTTNVGAGLPEDIKQKQITSQQNPPLQTNANLSSAQIQQIAQSQKATIIEYSIIFEDIYIWVILPNGEIAFRRANLKNLTPQPLSLQGKGENSKPLSLQERGFNANLESIILKSRVSIGIEEKDADGQKIKLETEFKRDIQGRYPLLQLLYEILISPIADLLPKHPNAKVIFIPHYNLFLVPFTALQNPADGSYLIEKHTILTAPSIQVLDLTHQHQENIRGLKQGALVVGDPLIAPKFSQAPYNLKPVPAAKEAAEQIAALLETEAITGEKATKAVIMDRILGVRIAHISAHGLLDDFGDSGIPGAIILAPASATDDGAIRAIDILALKLNSEIVVLSACSTGKGKITGDGIIGLSRCFILAGVPSLIVSLWNMGALSAKLLMTEFYQNLERGKDRAAALRDAMLTTKARFSRPADWAAFTLIGETESLSIETQKVEQKELTMPFSPESTPKEIIDAFVNLYDTSDLFDKHREALAKLNVAPTESAKEIAKKIEAWCEDKPLIKENMDNELCQMGAGGTESKPDDEVVREFNDRLIENRTRLGSPPPSSGTKDKN